MTAYWQYVRCENQHLSWDTIRLYQQGEVDFLWFLPPDDLFFIIQVPWERALPFHVFICNQNAGTVPNPEMKNNICNNWVSCLPANLKLHLKHFLKCRQCGLSIVLRWLSPVAGELFFFPGSHFVVTLACMCWPNNYLGPLISGESLHAFLQSLLAGKIAVW